MSSPYQRLQIPSEAVVVKEPKAGLGKSWLALSIQ